jgi:AcrR family transcriptional regulator
MSADIQIKHRIIEGAEELFFKFGVSKVTMEEIADALGMSKKTLYQYFSSKDELVKVVSDKALSESNDFMSAVTCDTNLNVSEKLKQMMNFIATMYARMGRSLLHDLRKNFPEIWKAVHEHRRRCILKDFGKMVHDGVQEGVFRQDIDESLLISIYLNTVESMLNPDVLAELPYTPAQVFAAISKIMFEGLLTQAGREKFCGNPLEKETL